MRNSVCSFDAHQHRRIADDAITTVNTDGDGGSACLCVCVSATGRPTHIFTSVRVLGKAPNWRQTQCVVGHLRSYVAKIYVRLHHMDIIHVSTDFVLYMCDVYLICFAVAAFNSVLSDENICSRASQVIWGVCG